MNYLLLTLKKSSIAGSIIFLTVLNKFTFLLDIIIYLE